jgi:hypothetical protein
MHLLAALSASAFVAFLLLGPDEVAGLLRNGSPLAAIDASRLNFLRVLLSVAAFAFLFYAVLFRNARSWRHLHRVLFMIPLVGLAVVIAYKLQFGVRDPKYLWFIREDGPVEYATAIVYLLTTAIIVAAFRKASDHGAAIGLGLLGAATLFVGLSEISFGQRIFGIKTPEAYASMNTQGEITIHNLRGVQIFVYRYIPLIMFAYVLFSRLLVDWLKKTHFGRQLPPGALSLAAIPWYAVPYFLPMAVYALKSHFIADYVWQDQEPSELTLSIGFLIIAAHAYFLFANADAGRSHSAAAHRGFPPQHPS